MLTMVVSAHPLIGEVNDTVRTSEGITHAVNDTIRIMDIDGNIHTVYARSVTTEALEPAKASTFKLPEWFPKFNATIRTKYELNTENGSSRFKVRNARFTLTGKVLPMFEYKAEIDLCDEGSIKMRDAWVRYAPEQFPFTATIGQMRVPFSIDAHRSPHVQYFSNRSFLAKYGGNIRDVGFAVQYNIKGNVPVTLQSGIFNGSGITNQKDYWTKTFNFSFKAQAKIGGLFTVEASCQKAHPEDVAIMMWNGGAFYDDGLWHVEGEYLRKNYRHKAFDGVNIVNSFISRKFPINRTLSSISASGRYDYMSDNSNGVKNEDGVLTVTQSLRHRMTVGTSLMFGTKHWVELRVNYEKFFFHQSAVKASSDCDKLVVEVICRF